MNENVIERLREIVGTKSVLTESRDVEAYLVDWRGAFHGEARAIVFPATTVEVAQVISFCREAGIPVVPQGGNTGLAAGATPLKLPNAIVLNLSNMRNIRTVDAAGSTMTVEAGCVLAQVQEAAAQAGRFFPLSFGAEGSAQIGGVISTNAGGSGVLRYGSTRALVLGLEVVLADGSVIDGLRTLRKDNAGYDWKQWFIGAEGTLGIITAATLRLFPKPRAIATALLATQSPKQALELFVRMQNELGDTLTACELFPDTAVALRIEQNGNLRLPIARAPWYLLLEASSSLPNLRDAFEAALAAVADDEGARDVILAESTAQADTLWEWRESIPETEKRASASAKHDVSVPISDIPQFIAIATAEVERVYPGSRVIAFGHVGDGNVHFNVLLPGDGSATAEAVNRTVHAIVACFRGSITAEHGIGRYRRAELYEHRASAEIAMMRSLKNTLDPENLMNPGAIFM
jgi:FAD/FMN-containing dehydrogenase